MDKEIHSFTANDSLTIWMEPTNEEIVKTVTEAEEDGKDDDEGDNSAVTTSCLTRTECAQSLDVLFWSEEDDVYVVTKNL